MAGLYLHVPFCLSKCPYCDFYSVADRQELLDGYHRLLISQLQLALESGWCGPFETVFFGGGTPSLLQPGQVAEILAAVAAQAGLTADIEISLEANPGTLTPESLAGYRAAGVNRLSLGIQSLDDQQLRRLGRRHDRQGALAAIRAARSAGFDNLSLDLMFALPGQGLTALQEELRQLLSCQPEHLAIYGLTIEEGTPFARHRFSGAESLPDEDLYAEMYLLIDRELAAAGFEHYEISNFARPGRECRHNLNYWRRGGYLGLGTGAHSFNPQGWGERLAVPDDLPAYLAQVNAGTDPLQLLEGFDRQGAMIETAYLALRTATGLQGDAFVRRFGADFAEVFSTALQQLQGTLFSDGQRWWFHPADWLLYDQLISAFF